LVVRLAGRIQGNDDSKQNADDQDDGHNLLKRVTTLFHCFLLRMFPRVKMRFGRIDSADGFRPAALTYCLFKKR
jgi:hypothetical protein